jgi:hypothetical protein
MLTGVYNFLFNLFTLPAMWDYAIANFNPFPDVIWIVVDVSPVRFHKSFERSMPCRHVMLLNMR